MKNKKSIVIFSSFILILVIGVLFFYLRTGSKQNKIEQVDILEDISQVEDTNLIDDVIEEMDKEIDNNEIKDETKEAVSEEQENTKQPVQIEVENKKTVISDKNVTTSTPKNNNSNEMNKSSSNDSKNANIESNNQMESVSTNSGKQEKEEKINTTKELTPNDLEYWCIHGGKHHLSGDGANEHGYYSTWDKAYKAFEEYSKDWASGQYKVSQCECGLYYFWAIEN